MAGFDKLPQIGEDHIKSGFLSKSFAEKVINRINALSNISVLYDPNFGVDSSDERIAIRVQEPYPQPDNTQDVFLNSDQGVMGWTSSVYKWIGQKYDKTNTWWEAWFSDATASFIPDDDKTDHLEKFAAEIGTNDTSAFFHLLIGDSTQSNDIMLWNHNNHVFRLSVYDYPQIELHDTDNDAGIKLWNDGTTPYILLADVYDDPTTGNRIEIDLDTGPEITLTDDTDNVITIDLTSDPVITRHDVTASQEIEEALFILQSDTGTSVGLTSQGTGDMVAYDGTYWSLVDGGNEGDLLSINSDGFPEWADLGAHDGDMLYYSSGWTTLAKASNDGELITSSGGDPVWTDMIPGAGDIPYYTDAGWACLSAGGAVQGDLIYLNSSNVPEWTGFGSLSNGDMIYYYEGTWALITGGSDGDYLKMVGSTPTWTTPEDC